MNRAIRTTYGVMIENVHVFAQVVDILHHAETESVATCSCLYGVLGC